MNEKPSLDEIKQKPIPKHLAIIMDGNGRWAKKRNMPRTFGHKKGTETVEKIVDFASEIGVEVLSLYAFSTENWKRPADEIENIIGLLNFFIDAKANKLLKEGVILRISGDLTPFPKTLKNKINDLVNRSKNNYGIILNICLNYGGRAEITDAVKKLIKEFEKSNKNIQEITYDDIDKYLYTAGLPDVDLLIRPSGEQRLSNFLLLQSAYAELWFSDILWPDFSEEDLLKAISDYQKRDRRFGGI